MARLAQKLCQVEYELSSFEPGMSMHGMMEFPFSIRLPEEVTESLMINFGVRSASQSFFMRAQMMPQDPQAYSNQMRGDISILRTDSLLLCYNPDDEGDIMPQG